MAACPPILRENPKFSEGDVIQLSRGAIHQKILIEQRYRVLGHPRHRSCRQAGAGAASRGARSRARGRPGVRACQACRLVQSKAAAAPAPPRHITGWAGKGVACAVHKACNRDAACATTHVHDSSWQFNPFEGDGPARLAAHFQPSSSILPLRGLTIVLLRQLLLPRPRPPRFLHYALNLLDHLHQPKARLPTETHLGLPREQATRRRLPQCCAVTCAAKNAASLLAAIPLSLWLHCPVPLPPALSRVRSCQQHDCTSSLSKACRPKGRLWAAPQASPCHISIYLPAHPQPCPLMRGPHLLRKQRGHALRDERLVESQQLGVHVRAAPGVLQHLRH